MRLGKNNHFDIRLLRFRDVINAMWGIIIGQQIMLFIDDLVRDRGPVSPWLHVFQVAMMLFTIYFTNCRVRKSELEEHVRERHDEVLVRARKAGFDDDLYSEVGLSGVWRWLSRGNGVTVFVLPYTSHATPALREYPVQDYMLFNVTVLRGGTFHPNPDMTSMNFDTHDQAMAYGIGVGLDLLAGDEKISKNTQKI